MLAAISGVSLTFISMGFITEIFAAPCTALVPMLLMLVFYAGQVKLPLHLPGGFVALASFVDAEFTTVDASAVQLINGGLSLIIRAHFDEGEAS